MPISWKRNPDRSDVALVSQRMKAFSTNVKRSTVTMQNGSVRTNGIGRMTALNTPDGVRTRQTP